MNMGLISLELAVLVLGLAVLVIDLWTPPERKRVLGYIAAIGLAEIFLISFLIDDTMMSVVGTWRPHAFSGAYVLDPLSVFFKRFFLLAAIAVLIISVEFADRIESGVSEYFGLMVMALAGMMFASSAAGFTMVFVSIELITVTFYVLTSFQRNRLPSLEAGIKYLILGALASGLMVYGIALVYGTSGTMMFQVLAREAGVLAEKPLFLLGLLLVLAGLAFKIAAFPIQVWAPDVYQGAPTPTTAFLAVGSKAAGIVVLMRLLFVAVPEVTAHWPQLLMALSAVTILYGNLAAIPQRSLKRLLGYSSIAHAGYLLLGFAAMAGDVHDPTAGGSAILYYLTGYLFTVLAAFAVLSLALQKVESDDISSLAGLGQRAPLIATAMTLAMVSLAGVPPLAGFFGKFMLLKAAVDQGVGSVGYYWLIGVALFGVVVSLYYYFGVIRAIYWSQETPDLSPVAVSTPFKAVVCVCMAGMLYLGLFPGTMVNVATRAVQVLKSDPVLRPPAGQNDVVAHADTSEGLTAPEAGLAGSK